MALKSHPKESPYRFPGGLFSNLGGDGWDLMVSEHFSIQVAFQSNANHPLVESTGYIKFEGMYMFYFDLDVTFTLMCDIYLINDLWPHTKD